MVFIDKPIIAFRKVVQIVLYISKKGCTIFVEIFTPFDYTDRKKSRVVTFAEFLTTSHHQHVTVDCGGLITAHIDHYFSILNTQA